MARRFFAKEEDIKQNEITIFGQEHFHLSKVLRVQVEDEILISTDKGNELECSILKIAKDFTLCKILNKTKIEETLADVTVFQAVMKGEHMDFVVQKLTELGVKKLVPFLSKFVVVKTDDKKSERFQRISFEACKQSNRKIPMQISKVLTFETMLETLKNYEQKILAFEGAKNSAKEILSGLDKNKSTALIIGSEGGFSQEEVLKLESIGAKIISLGKTILRGETASLALASVVLYEFDKWSI